VSSLSAPFNYKNFYYKLTSWNSNLVVKRIVCTLLHSEQRSVCTEVSFAEYRLFYRALLQKRPIKETISENVSENVSEV